MIELNTKMVLIYISIGTLLISLLCYFWGMVIDRGKENRTKGLPFAEGHPKLNMAMSLFLIIFMGSIGLIIIGAGLGYAGAGIKRAIDWLALLASKIDAVVIVALIAAVLSFVGVVISSIISKLIDYRKGRQDYLAQKREEPYGEFVEMVYKIQQNTKKEGSYTEEMMLNDLSKFSREITLWGSSRVVNKWVKFRENGAKNNTGLENLFLLEEIMNDMRKDLGLKKVNKGKLLAFFVNDVKKSMKAVKK